MLKILLFFISIASLLGTINVGINKTILYDIKEAYVPLIIDLIRVYPIPQVEYDGMKFRNFKIENLTIPKNFVDVRLLDNAVYVEITKSHLQLSLEAARDVLAWEVAVNIQFGVAINNLTISLDYNPNGPGNFSVRYLDVSSGQVELGLTGWMKVIIAWLIEGQYDNGSLQTAVQNNLRTMIRQGLQMLLDDKTFPSKLPMFGDHMFLNITPIQSPLITNDYISVNINGTFYNDDMDMFYSNITEPPFTVYDHEASSKVQVLLSNKSLNSFIYSVWQNNLLEFNVTKNDVKSDIAGLDTGSLSIAIPRIIKYGDNQEVFLNCYTRLAQGPPTLYTQADKIFLRSKLQCEVYVDTKTNWTRAVNIVPLMEAVATAQIVGDKIIITFTEAQAISVTYNNSTVGGMSTKALKDVINMALGAALPLQQTISSWNGSEYNLIDMRLGLKNSYIELLSDYKYIPQ